MSLMNKLGLVKSGTLLVSFPLICQVIFVIALFFPLLNLQSNISRLTESAELISKTISLMNHKMNLGYVAKINGPGRQKTGCCARSRLFSLCAPRCLKFDDSPVKTATAR